MIEASETELTWGTPLVDRGGVEIPARPRAPPGPPGGKGPKSKPGSAATGDNVDVQGTAQSSEGPGPAKRARTEGGASPAGSANHPPLGTAGPQAPAAPVVEAPAAVRAASRRFFPLRVTLIGDAVHPMSPYKGQGACQSLRDAPHLAGWLAKAAMPAALRGFEREMQHRAGEKVRASREAAVMLHSVGRERCGGIFFFLFFSFFFFKFHLTFMKPPLAPQCRPRAVRGRCRDPLGCRTQRVCVSRAARRRPDFRSARDARPSARSGRRRAARRRAGGRHPRHRRCSHRRDGGAGREIEMNLQKVQKTFIVYM
jgi:hypothetical protein